MSNDKIKKICPDFITVEEALDFDTKTAEDLTFKHLNTIRTQLAASAGLSGTIKKAEGCHLWDTDGNEHLDFIGDVGVYCLGINNPLMMEKLRYYLDSKPLTMDPCMVHQTTAAFAHNMNLLIPEMEKTVVCGGGGMEANETMLKMAMIAAYRTKKGRKRFVTTIDSFHGKSSLTVQIAGRDVWKEWQNPLPTDYYVNVPYGDWQAVEEEFKKGDVIAFMAETIQGEGGINIPPEDYFPKVRELCDKYDVYMLLDEVQCGSCRTGYKFAWQYYGDKAMPDAFSMAKGLSAGIVPVSAVQAKKSLYDAAYGSPESAFMHTATFQDNQVSGAVANAALQFMIEEDVETKIRERGAKFIEQLKEVAAKYPDMIKEVRGRGYMVGVEFLAAADGTPYGPAVASEMSVNHRVHIMTSNNADVVRIYPNITTTEKDFEWFFTALAESLDKVKKDFA